MMINPEEINTRFTYHPPRAGQPAIYEQIRYQAKELAISISALTPPSREQSLAITALEESVMWANAAVARRSVEEQTTTHALGRDPHEAAQEHVRKMAEAVDIPVNKDGPDYPALR